MYSGNNVFGSVNPPRRKQIEGKKDRFLRWEKNPQMENRPQYRRWNKMKKKQPTHIFCL